MPRTVTVISRHARPLCENAHAHGWRVRAADGFNDWDTARFAAPLTAGGMKETPGEFLAAWKTAPGPLLFGAPIEAAPEVLAEAAASRKVLNPPAGAVAMTRDPVFLRNMARGGVRFPVISFRADAPDAPGAPTTPWIVKSAKTAGGTGIRPDDGALKPDEYRQEFIHGESIGGLFFSAAGRCVFLGASLHLNHGFLYGGGIFPAPLHESAAEALKNFGARVTETSGITGWWGADFILNGEALWLLEINPRPTATAELFAKLHGIDLIAAQARPEHAPDFSGAKEAGAIGNRVVYAAADFAFGNSAGWFAGNARDIPHEGSAVKKGSPVLTLYAGAATAAGCRALLEEKTAAAHAAFAGGK